MPERLKGLVLAAGLGTRLRPLTERYAKPLMPFAGSTPLELALWRFHQLGVKDVAVNSHYHAEQMATAVSARPFGLSLKLSHEAEILGTGGAYNPLRAWLGDDDLLVINGDIVSSIDVAKLWQRHKDARAVATMALLPSVITGESAVFFEKDRIVGIGKVAPSLAATAGNFACMQILSPRFLDLLPKTGTFDVISKGYAPALAQALPIAAFVHEGLWHDLRTPGFYWAALRDFLADKDPSDLVGAAACRAARGATWLKLGTTLVNKASMVEPTASLDSFVLIEGGCSVGAGAKLSDCLLLPGAKVPPGAVVKSAILGENLALTL